MKIVVANESFRLKWPRETISAETCKRMCSLTRFKRRGVFHSLLKERLEQHLLQHASPVPQEV